MKKMLLKFTLVFLLVPSILLISQRTHAYASYSAYHSSYSDGGNGWIVQGSGIYYFTTQGGNPNTTITREILGGLAGYHFNLFFVGANYDYDSIVTSGGGNPTSTDSFRSFGGDIGLMTDNIYLLFAYYFSSIGTIRGGTPAGPNGPIDYNNGNGYQIKLGYNINVGSGFGVGPSLVYKNLTYNNLASGGATSYTFATLVPQVDLRYSF